MGWMALATDDFEDHADVRPGKLEALEVIKQREPPSRVGRDAVIEVQV